MKKPLLLAFLLLIAFFAYPQKPLTNSRITSYYTYIYKLDDASTVLFLTGKQAHIKEASLTNEVAKYPTDRPENILLPAGNYLKVAAVKNKLMYKLIQQRTANLMLMNGGKDVSLVLMDAEGKEITDAEVYRGNKLIVFDRLTETYHIGRSKKDSIYRVVYKGVNNFYNINQPKPFVYKNYNTQSQKPLARFWRKIKNLFSSSKVPERNNYYQRPTPNPGFMVFNKPKYRPGDTVKFKAFILQKKSYRPVEDKQLVVRLKRDYREDGKIIGYVKAYRKGGFEYQFRVDQDSLELELDDRYTISLETMESVNYDPSKFPDKKNDWEIIGKRTMYQQSTFQYEDYTLKSNQFNVRVDKRDGSPGLPTSLYFKATDDNGLNITDGRVIVQLQTGYVTAYGGKKVFVPDTLWRRELPLDVVGETKMTLPDSVFPKANLNFMANITLLNSDNESRKKNESLIWSYQDHTIKADIDNDSLKIDYLIKGKSMPATAWLTRINKSKDTTRTVQLSLPAQLAVGPITSSFIIKVDSISKLINVADGDKIEVSSFRSADSLFINILNPRKIKLWYTIFGGNKIIEQGSTLQLNYRKPIKHSGDITMMLNYVWAGTARQREEQVPLLDKYLHISVNQPTTVYPGQQSDIEIDVKDHKGKSVANADITAYSITKKFENYQKAYVPYLGGNFKYRKPDKLSQLKLPADTGRIKLNWQHWAKGMGLDSIEYYRFTHPDSVYTIEEDNPGRLTQVAPFVVENGEILPIHMLSIDLRPVYFSQSGDLPRYSFRTSFGKHTLTLRTRDKVITLNNVDIPFGKKLILSVNADSVQNPKLSYQNMPDTLTKSEQILINSYTIAVRPTFAQMATVRQDDRTFLINYNLNNYGYYSGKLMVVGPLSDKSTDIQIKGAFSREFNSEGGYTFEFQPGLIKQKSFPAKPPYITDLTKLRGATEYRQYPLTWMETENIWQDYLIERNRNGYTTTNYFAGGGKLVINPGKTADGKAPYIKNIMLFQDADPDFMQVYTGIYTYLGSVTEGKYRLLFILKDNSYYLMDNITIKAGGTNYFDAGTVTPHAPDSLSKSIADILAVPGINYIRPESFQKIKEIFNGRYIDPKALVGEVTGYVFDAKTKEPLAGTRVNVQSTMIQTQADIKGFFKIKVPAKGILNFACLTYLSQSLKIEPGKKMVVNLISDGNALQDVVIRGYVKRNREQTTGSSYIITGKEVQDNPVGNVEQLLQGKVAGLNIQNNTTSGLAMVNVNGVNTAINTKKLFVVDGVVMDEKDFTLSEDMIASRSILTGAAATAIYGALGANGVIIITTKKAEAAQASETLRRNFSDYAYWQPRLVTDANGKAKFRVTFPDDITAWRTFVIGITDKRQTGTAESEIKSYKPLSANFVSPVFAVKGDRFSALGKVLNYTTDTLQLKRKFTYNGQLMAENNISLQNSRIDTFKLVAAGNDSLSFEYSIKRNNGYFDGERRLVPLFEQGSLETKGSFDVLEKDTVITIKAIPDLKEATVRAEASALPALLDETEHLRNYEYLCNEQLASKLKALLAERQIRGYLKLPFKWDNNINDIIKKLIASRTSQGTWGWWKDTEEEIWITNHAVEALLDAKAKGFTVNIDYNALMNYLISRIASNDADDKLTTISLLKKLNNSADLKVFVTDYEKTLSPKKPLSIIDKYRLMLTRQSVGLPIVIDSLLKDMKRTMFGNIYWGKNSYYFFDNSIQQSLLAYRIIKNEGNHAPLLNKLRNYFMEQRADGHWRNTYESAQILETILPDMLTNGQQSKPSQLTISGDKTATVTQFPYTTTLAAGSQLKIAKTGDMAVYITAYQKFWNPTPQKVSDNFAVDTWFTKGQNKVTKAKGGELIYLTAEVTVKADADFVMIEIPIPAGCSYESKTQGYYSNGEIHREYLKNKVSIFCRKLKAGKYQYHIQLLARYAGNYHVNPSKAEMMYFPVFYGREGMKMFDVE
jgi:TonB-dependent SusC/RagA subfamily outer membrane receptor